MLWKLQQQHFARFVISDLLWISIFVKCFSTLTFPVLQYEVRYPYLLLRCTMGEDVLDLEIPLNGDERMLLPTEAWNRSPHCYQLTRPAKLTYCWPDLPNQLTSPSALALRLASFRCISSISTALVPTRGGGIPDTSTWTHDTILSDTQQNCLAVTDWWMLTLGAAFFSFVICMAAASCETGSSVGLLFVEVCLRAGIPPDRKSVV